MGGGGQNVVTGHNFFGSVAQVVAMGPWDILHKIRNGETVVYNGPIFRTEAMDGAGKTAIATTIGNMRFYWGTFTQAVDPLLAAMQINQGGGAIIAPQTPLRGVVYCVGDDIAFGQQSTPPTLTFEGSKFPSGLAVSGKVTRVRITAAGTGYASSFAVTFTGGGGSGAAGTATAVAGKITSIAITSFGTGYTSAPAVVLTAGGGTGGTATAYIFHERSGDALIPEVLYDFMTNTLYGAGMSAADIDTASWLAAAESTFLEDLVGSPFMDEHSALRDIVGNWLSYIDAFPFVKDGKLFLQTMRKPSLVGVTNISEKDLLEEPKPSNQGYAETWNITRLTFTDRSNKWEEGVEPYDDSANAALVGQRVEKTVDMPFIGRRAVAKAMTKLIGVRNGIPPVFYDLKLPFRHRGIVPGQVLTLTFAKLGLTAKPVRVMEKHIADANDGTIQLRVLVEQTRDTSFDYSPPNDQFTTPGFLDEAGGGDFAITPTIVRLAWLPSDLKAGKLDGWLAAFHRTDNFMKKAKMFWTWNPGIKAYAQVKVIQAFPAFAEVLFFHRVRGNSWVMRVKANHQRDLNTLSVKGAVETEYLAVCGQRQVRLQGSPSDAHNINTFWLKKTIDGIFAPQDTLVYDVEIVPGQFSTAVPALETSGVAATVPGRYIYFGRQEEFMIFPSDTINFERNAANAKPNQATGINPDTDLKRYVKITLANTEQEQALSDGTEAYFDRNDSTLTASGTYSPDWGGRAMTGYEFADVFIGQGFDLPNDADYLNADDADEAFGDIHEGIQTDDQFTMWEDIDRVLGLMVDRTDGIYNDAP